MVVAMMMMMMMMMVMVVMMMVVVMMVFVVDVILRLVQDHAAVRDHSAVSESASHAALVELLLHSVWPVVDPRSSNSRPRSCVAYRIPFSTKRTDPVHHASLFQRRRVGLHVFK